MSSMDHKRESMKSSKETAIINEIAMKAQYYKSPDLPKGADLSNPISPRKIGIESSMIYKRAKEELNNSPTQVQIGEQRFDII